MTVLFKGMVSLISILWSQHAHKGSTVIISNLRRGKAEVQGGEVLLPTSHGC